LGQDGHSTIGIPAPPADGQRRMFAGGRVRTLALLRIGEPATRTTEVVSTAKKMGRSGPLTFVTVSTQITQGEETAVVEEQDILYRAPPTDNDSISAEVDNVHGSEFHDAGTREHLKLEVDEALLFRFSALTYNAHRIHYDHTW